MVFIKEIDTLSTKQRPKQCGTCNREVIFAKM